MRRYGPIPLFLVSLTLAGCGSGVTAPAIPTAELTETYWKLTLLREAAVTAAPNQREPHLVFQAEENRVAGSGGCNLITGTHTLDGSSLRIGRMGSTMMACAEGMETERAFLAALEQVRAWRIEGQHLELHDADGSRLARFEATHMD